MVDFHEAYENDHCKEKLKQDMDAKRYPPRFNYKIADMTKSHTFFNEPKILEYNLKGGKIDTMDDEGEINGEIVIPSRNTTG